ncbi:PspA/IM30 family protein [Heyndrickxia sp. NPDC080065]|uniref:PspA/IM30 family protein n=1 Tax=Heyndrickxia sp. NPDC080065 TaxID=3390568 RepID=UPI003CFDB53E
MTTLFERIKNAVMEDLQCDTNKKGEKNPIALLNKYLHESEKETDRVGKLIERQYMLKEEFHRELQTAEFMVEKRKKQAEIALAANEMTLYETAIHEESLYKDQALRLKEAYDQAGIQLEQLEIKHREMQMKLKDMHIKRLELMGRENVIKVNSKANSVLDHTFVGKATNRFEETGRYVDQLEQKINKGYDQSLFDTRIEQLEKELNQTNND